MVGKVIEYPFDTVKVRLQSQPNSLPLLYKGPLDCLKQSFRTEGVWGLYRGVSAPLFGAAVETSSLFFSYRLAQEGISGVVNDEQNGKLPLGALAVCGAASGAFTSLLLTPIELVKCQLQAPQGTPSKTQRGPLSVIIQVYRHQGIAGFWRGQLGTLIRETGGSACWFGSYEGVSGLFRQFNVQSASHSESTALPIWQQLLAGASAGVSYNFVFYPADTIKSRMQTERLSPLLAGERQNFWAAGQSLWRQQGLKGMYRGCGITVVRAAPSSAFIFTVYEALRGCFS